MSAPGRLFPAAPRYSPLIGMLIGAVGGGVYWLGTQIWPASIAVVLAMLASASLAARSNGEPASVSSALGPTSVLCILLNYAALMALSPAKLPFALPPNVALGIIMIAGHAVSRALVVSVLASPTHSSARSASLGDLGIALALGIAPAALIGIPGLVGLAAAIAARILYIAWIARSRQSFSPVELDMTRRSTETCFYLGALAAWAYI